MEHNRLENSDLPLTPVARAMHRILVFALLGLGACVSPQDQTSMFIQQMDAAPPGQRPPDWEITKKLMGRVAPRVGDPAPDFTLETTDQTISLTRSTFQSGKPLVLIFGSFT
jgi:hypothetical protein